MTSLLSAPARYALLVLQGLVGLSALAGGGALVIGAASGASGGPVPPADVLAGTPFATALVPGLLLVLVVGGSHLLALVVGLVRDAWAPLLSTVAGFALLIWIFVQVLLIPFSVLQVAYEVAALLEVGLVLVRLGVLDVLRPRGRESFRRATRHAVAQQGPSALG